MYRVFIVDDEPWALSGLAELIDWEANGFKVAARFTDPQEALKCIRELRPDVVFTDIRMPFLSGIELIELARREKIDTEFVLISCYEDFEAAKKAIKLNVCQYIAKPYDEDEVMETVETLKKRLQAKKKLVCFDINDSPSTLAEKLAKVEKLTSGHSGYYICYLNSQMDAPPRMEGEEWIPIGVRKVPSAYLVVVNGVGRSIAQYYVQPPGKKIEIGISRMHTDAEKDFQDMLREAWFSLHCGFSFSEKDVVARIQYFLCLSMEKNLSLKEIAEHFHFSEAYLCELFKKGTQQSVMKFIQTIRVNYAAYLIRTTNKNLQDIAREVGFVNYSYFGKLFKKYHKITPENYRKRHAPALRSKFFVECT